MQQVARLPDTEPTSAILFNDILEESITLVVKKEILGKGAMKTAQECAISKDTFADEAELRALPFDHVYKLGFIPAHLPKIVRPPNAFHNGDMVRECFAVRWAISLLEMARRWIQSIKVAWPEPFPNVQYVATRLCLVGFAEARHACLVEERIQAPWEKFINNGSAMPQVLTKNLPEGDALVEFLCFIQHVQLWKTKGLAYVSDFQGGRSPDSNGYTLLSDPQVMSSPYVVVVVVIPCSEYDSYISY